MASESSEDNAVRVALPADLDEWLDAKATELGVDRGTVVERLLASYRAASELDDPGLESVLGDEFEAEVSAAVGEPVDAVEDRLATEIDGVERDFREKIEDVRERVVQVKRDADAKAPADHTHPELGELATLSTEVDALESRLDAVDETLADRETDRADLAARVDELETVVDRLDDAEEKLQTVAWVVSDLRDAVESGNAATSAVDRLKRSAAEADVDRAVCEGCGDPVDIALLSEPTCPHCDAAVSDVELPGGFFGNPKLVVAQRLEAGDDADDDGDATTRANVPDAARRE